MELKPNPHAIQSGDIFPKKEVTQVVKPTLAERGVIGIWERCIARWQDNVNHEKMPVPTAFLEMTFFIEELKDKI